jgi:hypothetical protein
MFEQPHFTNAFDVCGPELFCEDSDVRNAVSPMDAQRSIDMHHDSLVSKSVVGVGNFVPEDSLKAAEPRDLGNTPAWKTWETVRGLQIV